MALENPPVFGQTLAVGSYAYWYDDVHFAREAKIILGFPRFGVMITDLKILKYSVPDMCHAGNLDSRAYIAPKINSWYWDQRKNT